MSQLYRVKTFKQNEGFTLIAPKTQRYEVATVQEVIKKVC